MILIPLELQPTLNTSRRKAREAYLTPRGQTLESSGMNRRNERVFFFFFTFYCVAQTQETIPHTTVLKTILLTIPRVIETTNIILNLHVTYMTTRILILTYKVTIALALGF